MRTYINYIKESKDSDYEKLFIKLSHLDELEIKFDFTKYSECVYYFYSDKDMFELFKRSDGNYFYINIDIYSILLKETGKKQFLEMLVEKYFKLTNVSLMRIWTEEVKEIELQFKI